MRFTFILSGQWFGFFSVLVQYSHVDDAFGAEMGMVFSRSSLGHLLILIPSIEMGKQKEMYKYPCIPHYRQLYDNIYMSREALC